MQLEFSLKNNVTFICFLLCAAEKSNDIELSEQI